MTKKTAAPKTVEKKGTEIVKWEEELAGYAEKSAAQEKPSGYKSIAIKSGVMHVDDNPVKDNELEVVVLAAIHENQYFEGKYNPGETNLPVCYAFGDPEAADPEEGMCPHEKAPNKQHDGNCADCPMNQWGTADTGKGKACKNVRKLAVMVADSLENAEEPEVRTLKIPVTSVKNWGSYLRNTLLEIKRPCWGVVTKIKVIPDPKNQFKMTFTFVEQVEFTAEKYTRLKKLVDTAQKDLTAPYPDKPELPEKAKPTPKGKAPARKGGKF